MSKLIELEQKLQQMDKEVDWLQKEIDALKKVDTRMDKAKSWSRVPKRGIYYFISGRCVDRCSDDYDHTDNELYNLSNYNTDKSYMERIKFEQDLWRKLKRFADQNNEGEIDWKDEHSDKYYIYYGHKSRSFIIYCDRHAHDFAKIYFTSKEIAQKAIETFKTELLEYFGA